MSLLSSWNLAFQAGIVEGDSLHIDLGCGRSPRNPFRAREVLGLDLMTACDVTPPFPFEYRMVSPGAQLPVDSSSADSVSGYDFLEHIPRHDRDPAGRIFNPFIELMNEVHRVLKPGGLFLAVTPAFPAASAFVDPTHVNFITADTHAYFCEPTNLAKSLGYGFKGSFEAVAVQWIKRWSPVWKSLPKPPETRFGPFSGLVRVGYESFYEYRHHPRDVWRDVFTKEHLLWVFRALKD